MKCWSRAFRVWGFGSSEKADQAWITQAIAQQCCCCCCCSRDARAARAKFSPQLKLYVASSGMETLNPKP